jgi:hypothetical protein
MVFPLLKFTGKRGEHVVIARAPAVDPGVASRRLAAAADDGRLLLKPPSMAPDRLVAQAQLLGDRLHVLLAFDEPHEHLEAQRVRLASRAAVSGV